MQAAPTVTRLPGRRTVLAVVRPAPDPAVAARLADAYRPFHGPGIRATHRRHGAADALVLAVGDEAPAALGDVVVWGSVVGADGVATDAEVRRALDDPAAARELRGAFVLLRLAPDGLRLVTSADLLHTLKQASGPTGGQAWATQGRAALVAAGRPLVLAEERVPELVLYDFVFGDDELLAGVRVLPEASVVDVGPAGAAERSWWPVAERFATGPPTTPEQLRAVVTDEAMRVAAVPDLHLALTAGRDSTLLAGCLAAARRPLPAFTIGDPAFPDVVGAAAVADRLGWTHGTVGVEGRRRPSVARLLAMTRWTDGLDTAWNFVGPPLRWPGQPAASHLAGSAGELGRAFFWKDADDAALADPVGVVTGWALPLLSPAAGRALRSRVEQVAAAHAAQGFGPERVLDLLHARGRVRSWNGRSPTMPGVVQTLTVYPSPSAVAALVNAPADAKRSGAVFDAAAALDGTDLRAAATAAVRAAFAAAPRSSFAARARRRLGREPGVAWAYRTLGALRARPPVAARVLGEAWWDRVRERAPYDAAARRWLWNAVAVEAVAADIEGRGWAR